MVCAESRHEDAMRDPWEDRQAMMEKPARGAGILDEVIFEA